MSKYSRLHELYCECAGLLNRAGIKFWINYGTLLGWYRHRTIIPWDYDADICMLKEDYEKAKEVLKDKLDIGYYGDDNCMAYLPKWSAEWDIGVDIVAYEVKDNVVECLISKKVQSEYNCIYDYQYDDVFPLREVIFCGDKALVPNNAKKILIEQYGNLEVPDGHSGSELRVFQIPHVDDLESGMTLGVPFIVRAFQQVPDRDALYKNFLDEKEIYGYGYENEADFVMTGAGILEEWKNNDVMSIKLLDCYCTNEKLVPGIIKKNQTWPDIETKYMLNYILTGNGLTKFHMDPSFGGGWMYLYEGQKLWWFIDWKDCKSIKGKVSRDENPEISDEEIAFLKKASLTELLNDGYKVWVGLANSGDLIRFPQAWIHRVYTYEKSIGCGGYI